ncbi:cysteine hydrolase family protein [Marinifilum caeruleilacunae]|uniref:Cysteine hydrolase n=1 Tax=Marinifilum caeruleilacunae TaxID=2499076 RepID=A0ABX1WYR9_9BACT|nr:isochorismatase family cysteine hydrolase [Marinifilum caeruleilacunae]NOU61039.1 cysteine hydrolase [Marinifilum caeruleilacunae]
MFTKDILFWNVDTQIDFMSPDGKLYAPGAEEIQPTLEAITKLADFNNIQVINTADYHYSNSAELSANPDFVNTFPEHCMANSIGAEYINETRPKEICPEILWNKIYNETELSEAAKSRNIIIRKDAFDVFEGNPNTYSLLKQINPTTVFVYGVTTNVCVDCAAVGLAERGLKVYVIEDAIKELPNIPLPFDKWDDLGITRITYEKVIEYLA